MKLNVQERLTLVSVVPEKGSFETQKMIEALKDLLYPSEEESREFEIKQFEKTISWNKKGTEQIEIPLTEGHIELLNKQLELLDSKEELDSAQYQVFKRFKEKQ
jgi:hypothetical protein